MKTLLLFFVLLTSANVFSHTCHISIYDPYNRPVLNFYSYWDNNCQEAARRCYQAIADNRLHPDYFKCYTISMTADQPQTQPQVQPRPQTEPQRPVQRPDYIAPEDREFMRELIMGETVYYQNKQWLVIYGDADNKYELMPVGGKKNDAEKNIDRSAISITRGCLRKVCTKSAVYYNRAQKEMAVEAIGFNGKYVLKDIQSKAIFSDVDYLDLRVTP